MDWLWVVPMYLRSAVSSSSIRRGVSTFSMGGGPSAPDAARGRRGRDRMAMRRRGFMGSPRESVVRIVGARGKNKVCVRWVGRC